MNSGSTGLERYASLKGVAAAEVIPPTSDANFYLVGKEFPSTPSNLLQFFV